jgi:cysteine-rich repeat protein
MDSITGQASCKSCDITKKLTLIRNDCQCITGYSFDANHLCKNICGDGFLIDQEQCDDGNTLPGDGCSSDCQYESGIELDMSKNPPVIKSQLMLKYKVDKILKNEG